MLRTAPEFIRGIKGILKSGNRFNGFVGKRHALSLRTAKVESFIFETPRYEAPPCDAVCEALPHE